MATQTRNPEAGIRRHRLDFARESEYGVIGANPAWLKYSSAFSNFTWDSGSDIDRVDAAGEVNPIAQEKGSEDHDVSVTYALAKWFQTAGGDPLDAAYDGLVRDADRLLPNSHAVVDRDERELIDASNTVNGATARPTRMYRVGKGGLLDEVQVMGDPNDTAYIQVELSYKFQKVRAYQIDQPTAAEGTPLIAVASTSAADTTQTVTIEDEGAATSVAFTLNGTTLVSPTGAAFGNIDAVELSAETEGDVEVYINTGGATGSATPPAAGDQLATIRGTAQYDGVEGDLGIPALGAGTRETAAAVGTTYEKFLGDRVLRGADPYNHEIPSATLTVSNNIETNPRNTGYGQAYHPGTREVTIEASMYGEQMTYDLLDYHLRNESQDHTWELTGGDLVVNGAHLTEPGSVEYEEGNAVLTTDNTFRGNDLTITTNP